MRSTMSIKRDNKPLALAIVPRQEEEEEDYEEVEEVEEVEDDGDDSDDEDDDPFVSGIPNPAATVTAALGSPFVRPTNAFGRPDVIQIPNSGQFADDDEPPSPDDSNFPSTTTISSAAFTTPPPTTSLALDQSEGFIGAQSGKGDISLSPAMQGILITFSILGGLGLIGLAFFCIRRRNRKNPTSSEKQGIKRLLPPLARLKQNRTPTSPSSPSLEDVIARPETTHVPTYRITRAKDDTAAWAAKAYTRRPDSVFSNARPDTVISSIHVTTPIVESRLSTMPQNPFADPQLNKSYDMIHNRPRSTTLTDTGDWLKNPFEDPRDERFDPFGTLREKAKDERKKYIAILKAEQEKHGQHKDVDGPPVL